MKQYVFWNLSLVVHRVTLYDMFILKETQVLEAPPVQAKEKDGLSKKTIDIFRTTQRNNIELTAIADNKANVLLSLNAIIIAALIPLIIANIEKLLEHHLYIPLAFLASTCFATIYLAAKVLKPSRFDGDRSVSDPGVQSSPFFFGNFYKMKSKEYYQFLDKGLSEPSFIKAHLAQDLFYLGRRLGLKMTWIRRAFDIFILGIFLTLSSLIICLFL